SPSFEEIAQHFGYTSLATVHEHVENLRQEGYIRKSYNASRSIELVRTTMVSASAVELPLYGNVAAGDAVAPVHDTAATAPPEAGLRRRGGRYALRGRGAAMLDGHLRDGGYVVVDSRNTAETGDMVVARVQGEAATVKRFYRERDGRIRLQPANERMKP